MQNKCIEIESRHRSHESECLLVNNLLSRAPKLEVKITTILIQIYSS